MAFAVRDRVEEGAVSSQSGNVFFMILAAIVLIGLLTAAIRSTSQPGGSNIDSETTALNVSRVRQYATELEHAVQLVIANGVSESDIRFAHPDASSDYGDITSTPTRQIFDPAGGAAEYRAPPANVNDGSAWEFYGGTALPDVGSDRADLIAVLPDVDAAFCAKVNEINGYDTATQPQDTGGSAASGSSPGDCLNGGAAARFSDTEQFYATPNTTDEASFTHKPATEGCALCALDGKYHFFHVLMAR